MKRGLLLSLIVLILLSACAVDPCTFDKTSPSCAVKQSESNATISAIDADREMRSTQSAIYLQAEGTKSAVSSMATKQVVQAEATQSAMKTDATRNAISAAEEQSKVIYASTQTFVDAEATKVYVQVGGAIDRANAERAAVPYNAVFNVVVTWFLLPGLVIGLLVVYGQRAVKRATEAATQAMHKRAAQVTYGPENDPRIGFLLFDPKTGQPTKFISADGMIGNFADLLTGQTVVDKLDVPDQMKLLAFVEASKRTTAAHISASTGTAPWTVTTEYAPVMEQAAPEALTPGYRINMVSPSLPPLPQWLDEVDRRLLEARYD
jgi:hypothetical protein